MQYRNRSAMSYQGKVIFGLAENPGKAPVDYS